MVILLLLSKYRHEANKQFLFVKTELLILYVVDSSAALRLVKFLTIDVCHFISGHECIKKRRIALHHHQLLC